MRALVSYHWDRFIERFTVGEEERVQIVRGFRGLCCIVFLVVYTKLAMAIDLDYTTCFFGTVTASKFRDTAGAGFSHVK